MKKVMKNLINEEMTVLELSHELARLGFGDIYNYGTLETNILDEGSVAVDEEILVTVEVIEELDGSEMALVKIINIEEL